MEAVLSNSFGIGYEKNKKEVYEELNSRINTVILNSIKGYLREKKIDFDGRSIDLNEFKSKVVPKLDKQTQIDVVNIEQGLNEQLKGVSDGLREGSTTAFKRFAYGVGSFTKSTVEMAARLTAVKAATALSPSLGGVALGASIMVPKVVKTVKDVNKDVKENTTAALDVMLLKLGTSKNDEEMKYDVPEETRKTIATNLKSEGIEVSTNDTLHFLQDITELDNKQKEKAVNMLNNAKGNPYDVKKEVEKTKINLQKVKKIIGDDVIAPLSTAALFGMSAGTTLMETAPDLAPSVVTALSAGALTGNLAIGAFSGGGQYAISKYGHYIPVVGDIIEDYTKQIGAKETLLATTGTAAVATLALKVIPSLVYKGAKGVYGKIKNQKESKDKKKELENEIAIEQIKEKMETAKNDANEEMESRKSNDIIIDVIRDTLESEGITIPKEIKTRKEFEVYVSKLPNEDKKRVYKIADILGDITENNTKTLKTSLMKVGRAAYWGGVIALAGLGVYDAFLNPGFIEGLADRDKIRRELSKKPQGSIQSSQDRCKYS